MMRSAAIARIIALALMIAAAPIEGSRAMTDGEVERLVAQDIEAIVPADGAGGVAVVVRTEGRTLFFNYGLADLAVRRPITSDSLFNLASVRKAFEAALLAEAVKRGELALDDPVAKHVPELRQGGYVREITLGQLATHTSGLLLPTDHPPWPHYQYRLADFMRVLDNWTPEHAEEPGKQRTYTHAGYILLQVALERRFGMPIAELMHRRLLVPLGMTSTFIPERRELAAEFPGRVVQGYAESGQPVGAPGDQQSYFDFPGTGQMFSSPRDLAIFVAAELGELPLDPVLRDAMQMTQQAAFRISPRSAQGMAWEVNELDGPPIVDKPGGLDNASTYVGLVPSRKLGLVILSNRGNRYPHEIAREKLLPALERASGP
jgi:beta-lactamase class C